MGRCFSQTQDSAFIWDAQNQMRDLRDVLVNDFSLDLTGWTLTQATGISDDGLTIAGEGINPGGDTEAWQPLVGLDVELRARVWARRAPLDMLWRRASFTAMTRGAHASAPVAAEVADHDAGLPTHDPEQLLLAAVDDGRVVPLDPFHRGARAGTFLHHVLEQHDFMDPDPDALPALVARELRRAGYDDPRWTEPVVGALGEALATPLGIRPDLRLCDLPRDRRLDELDFTFPAAGDLTPADLADTFAAHAPEPLASTYAAELRRLDFMPVRGYLVGSLDLVFEHGGRWYVADYKSNDLGPHPLHYRPERLAEAMITRHYNLQLHLYVVALHRWLGWRLEGYEYERHFGGALYLFLRGMSPSWPEDVGVHRERPPLALVEALSERLGGGR